MTKETTNVQNIRKFLHSLPPDVVSIRPGLPIEEYTDDIIPFELYRNTRDNIEKITDQINKSFYFGIYDGASILMRRLVEMLLILSFKEIGEENNIKNTDGDYFQLSKIITEAIANKKLDLSRNAKTYLNIFKEKGDLSAHNPFHISFKRDLELLQLKYRHLIQELLYKANILK